MKNHRLILSLACLLGLILCSCHPPTPQPPLPVAIEASVPAEQSTLLPTPTPDLSAQLSCSVNSDCVLAYRTDQCCACGDIYNRQTVDDDRGLRLVDEPPDYRYPKLRTPQKLCPTVACAPCPMPPFGLVCDANICRSAQSWQEIWSACEGLEGDQKRWCTANAATTAYKSKDEEQAATICNSLQGSEDWGTQYSEDCLLQVARFVMTSDPQAAASFCRAHMRSLLSHCLNETGFAIGRADVEAALALCNEIRINNENNQQQQDFCFHNVAMSVAKVDLAQAWLICESMSQEVERCKLDAENPQGVP